MSLEQRLTNAGKLPGKQIPPWRVKRLNKEFTSAKVTCPRCGFSVTLNPREWLKGFDFPTRPCMRCFGTNRLTKATKES